MTVQPQYNLLARAIEWEIVPACEAEGLGLLPWSPLASGWLTGKYRRDEPPAGGTRLSDQIDQGMRIWNERGHLERNWQVIDAVRKVAEGRGASMSQVAIAWVLARPAVRSVILGARTLAQLDDNLAAGDLDLSEDETGSSTRPATRAPRLPLRRARPDPARPPHLRRPLLSRDLSRRPGGGAPRRRPGPRRPGPPPGASASS